MVNIGGGGVNLGAATVYVMADGSGMRRELNRSSRDLDTFALRAAKTAEAMRKVSDARAAQAAAASNLESVADPRFLAAQQAMSDQVQKTSRTIERAYQMRTAAIRYHQRAHADATAREIARDKLATASKKRLAELDAEITRRRALLAKTAPPISGAARTSVDTALKKDLAERKRLTDAITLATNEASDARLRAGKAAGIAGSQIERANRIQLASTEDLKRSIRGVADEYLEIGDIAGGKYVQMARNIDNAANSSVRSMIRMRDANETLLRAQNALARDPSSATLARNVERAMMGIEAARVTHERDLNRMTDAERKFTSAMAAEYGVRGEMVDRETARLIAAQKAQDEAAHRRRVNALDMVGDVAARGFLGGAIAIGAATAASVSFEKEMANVAAISQEVDHFFGEFNQQVRDLAVSLGQSPTGMAEGLYEIAQAGFEGADAFTVLETAARAAVAGQTSVEQAARPLIGVLSAFNLEVGESERVMDLMFSGVTEGIFTFEELSSQLGDNLSNAAALNIGLDELMATYIVLTRRSNSLSESTTQVNAIMNSFLKPSEALTAAIHEMTGETAAAYFQNHDLAEVLHLVSQMFEENKDAAGRLFPNIRAIRGIFGLTAQEAAQFDEQLAAVRGSTEGLGATTEVLNRQMETNAFQMQKAWAQLQNAAIVMGDAMAPAVTAMIAGVGSLVQAFADLDPSVQQNIANVIMWTTAGLGAVLVMSKLITGAIALGKSLKTLLVGMGPVGIALTALAVVATRVIMHWQEVEQTNREVEQSFTDLRNAMREANSEAERSALQDLQLTLEDISLDDPLSMIAPVGDQRVVKQYRDLYIGMAEDIKAEYDKFWDKFARDQALMELGDFMVTSSEMAEINSLNADSFTKAGEAGDRYLAIAGLIDEQHRLNILSGDEMVAVLRDINDILTLNATGFHREAAVSQLENIFLTYEQIKATEGLAIAEEWLAKTIDATNSIAGQDLIETHADDLARAAGEAEALTAEEQALQDQIENVARAGSYTEEELVENAIAVARATRIATGSLTDMTDAMSAVQSRFGEGITVPETLLNMQEMGELDLNFGDAEQEALRIAAAIGFWEREVASLTATIDTANSEIGEWQGLQEMVSDAIGTEEDGYVRLTAARNAGIISQQDYNAILAAGVSVTDNATIAIDEQRTAIMTSLPELAAAIDQQERQKDAYDALNPSSKRRVDAMMDESNQLIILNVLFLKLLQHLGAIDQVTFDTLITELATVNDDVATMLDGIGLLPENFNIAVTMDATQAKAELDEVVAARENAERELRRALQADPTGIGEQAEVWRNTVADLTQREHELRLRVEADDQPLRDVSEEAGNIEEREQSILDIVEKQNAAREAAAQAAQDEADRILEVQQAWEDANDALSIGHDDLQTMADETLPELIAGIRPGLDDPFAWLTQGISEANDSFAFFLRNASRITGIDLNLDQATRDALFFQDALDASVESLTEVTDAMADHQNQIGQYEGYKSMLDEVLGESTSNLDRWNAKLALGRATQKEYNEALRSGEAHGAYENLNKLVQQGYLTQQEANAAIAAGASIRQRANQGIKQEQANLARLLPSLDAMVARHQEARIGYQNLTETQKGFLAAIQDEAVQANLSLALMLIQMEALGAIPEGMANRAISALSEINPVFGALAEEIGLLTARPNVLQIESRMNLDRTPKEVIEDAIPADGVVIPAKVTPTTDQNVSTDGAAAPAVDVASGMARAKQQLQADIETLEAMARRGGGIVSAAFIREMVNRLTIGANDVRTAMRMPIDALAEQVQPVRFIGVGLANSFIEGVVGALRMSHPVSEAAQSSGGPVALLGKEVSRAYQVGRTLGMSFLIGASEGAKDRALLKLLEAAGKDAGDTLASGAEEELEISSPSGRGIDVGEAFVEGTTRGVESGADELAYTGRTLANDLNDAVNDILAGNQGEDLMGIAAALDAMAQSESTVDYRQIEGFAQALEDLPDPTGRLGRAAGQLQSIADSAKTEIEGISSAGQDFGSNLEWAADQIAAFKGDMTPGNLVAMSLELRELAESSDQLDAAKLRAYADQLRATGDAKLAQTATYLDSIAADVDERARRHQLAEAAEAAEEQKRIAEDMRRAVQDEMDRLISDMPDVFKAFMRLPADVRESATAYMLANLRGDTDAIIAEYNRLAQFLDGPTLDKIAAAGAQARRNMPKGIIFSGGDFMVDPAVKELARQNAAQQVARESGVSLTEANNSLSRSYDNVTDSANQASGAIGRASGAASGLSGSAEVADLSDTLRRYMNLPDNVRALAENYMREAIAGNVDAAVAEYNRLVGQVDDATLNLLAAAGAELRRRTPPGWVLTPELDLVPAIDALVDSMPNLRSALESTFHGLQGAVSERMIVEMERFLAAFISGNRQAGLEAWNAIASSMTEEGQRALYQLAVSLREGGYNAGQAAGQGMVEGAASTQPAVQQSGSDLGASIEHGVHTALGMASPSRVMGEAGRNAAQSFVDRFLQTALQSIFAIRQTARNQVDAFRDEFERGVSAIDSATPDITLGRRQIVTDRNHANRMAAGNRLVNVTAPVTLGNIQVDGYNRDPGEIVAEMREQIWGDLLDNIQMVWAQVEGSR